MSKQEYFKLDILTPQGVVYSENVIQVKAPGRNGRFGVLLHHIHALVLLKDGLLEVQAIGGNKRFTIAGGVADVSDHYVEIITDSVEPVA